MIADAMIRALVVSGIVMMWSYFTLKTFRI